MAIVQLVGRIPTKEAFVSVEQVPLVLADVRKALPELKRELAKKYRIEAVELTARQPRLPNPMSRRKVIITAAVGILVTYVVGPAAKAASEKVGEAIGDAIVKFVRGWLKQFVKQGRDRPEPRKNTTRMT